jgi:NlpC/P60 family putative phage cell wall peptidase
MSLHTCSVAIQRSQVVREALTWLGTPYHHHGRIKGAGVDCAMLLLEVYQRAGLIPEGYDPGIYAPEWHLHRSEELYLAGVERFATPLPEGAEPQPGDIALFRFGRTISHGAIVLEWPGVIHSYRGQGVVLDDASNGPLAGRHKGCWTLWPEVG